MRGSSLTVRICCGVHRPRRGNASAGSGSGGNGRLFNLLSAGGVDVGVAGVDDGVCEGLDALKLLQIIAKNNLEETGEGLKGHKAAAAGGAVANGSIDAVLHRVGRRRRRAIFIIVDVAEGNRLLVKGGKNSKQRPAHAVSLNRLGQSLRAAAEHRGKLVEKLRADVRGGVVHNSVELLLRESLGASSRHEEVLEGGRGGQNVRQVVQNCQQIPNLGSVDRPKVGRGVGRLQQRLSPLALGVAALVERSLALLG